MGLRLEDPTLTAMKAVLSTRRFCLDVGQHRHRNQHDTHNRENHKKQIQRSIGFQRNVGYAIALKINACTTIYKQSIEVLQFHF